MTVPAALGLLAIIGPGCGGGTEWGGSSCDDVCPGAKLCDTALGCVDCRGDGDCGAAQPFCELGRCRECSQSDDCGTGQACFPRDHECKPACETNANCPEDDESLCNPDTGACVGCITDQDCGGKPFCNALNGKCSECVGDGDCGVAAAHCDIGDGECRQCLVDGHCGDNEKCNDGHCVLDGPCTSNGQCPDNQLCNTNDGDCVHCLVNADCNDGKKAFCSLSRDECVECLVSLDCDAGKTCNGEGKCD